MSGESLAGFGLRFKNGKLSYKVFRYRADAEQYASRLHNGTERRGETKHKAKVIQVVILTALGAR